MSASPAFGSSSNSSKSSFFTVSRRPIMKEEDRPLFVTWNTVMGSGHKSLRGCIGTFEPQELEYGLQSYALTS
jgi:AMMECR1 domain-containing protein